MQKERLRKINEENGDQNRIGLSQSLDQDMNMDQDVDNRNVQSLNAQEVIDLLAKDRIENEANASRNANMQPTQISSPRCPRCLLSFVFCLLSLS